MTNYNKIIEITGKLNPNPQEIWDAAHAEGFNAGIEAAASRMESNSLHCASLVRELKK